jgi:TRAP-type C4-dicarboxylate transport system permease small subunit
MEMILQAVERISSVSGWFSGVGVVIMAVLITVDVFLRYFFGKPLLFADDISVYSMIFITFVGAALTLKMKKHISVDLFYKMLSRRAKLWLDVATTFVGCFVIWVVTWYAIVWVRYTYESGYMSPGILGTPMWIPGLALPIGCFLFGLQYIVECVKVVRALHEQESEAKEGAAHA